jgi:hypothetical protein
MRRRSLGAALAASTIALTGAEPAAASSGTVVTFPPCLVVQPMPAFEAALAQLHAAAFASTACRANASCARATSEIQAAFESACEDDANDLPALARTARSVKTLAGARLPAETNELLLGALESLVAASGDLVAEAADAAEEAIAGLCTSARQGVARTLERAERGVDQAALDAGRGAWASALSRLSRAADEFLSVAGSAATAALRCHPRACRANAAFHFEAGASGNSALALVPPDRGTLAVYRVSASEEPSSSASGTLRLAYDGLSRAKIASRLASGGQTVDLAGTFSSSACLDGNGWYRLSSISETLRASNGARGGGSLHLTPPGVAVPPLGLVPVVPQAASMRVGDRIAESDFAVAVAGNRRAPPLLCSGEHRVVAVEDLEVEAGTFPAARVESFVACPGGPEVDWTSWLASGVGFVRVELRDADSYVEYELACVETPETAGACAAAAVPRPVLVGPGLVLQGSASIDGHALDAGGVFIALPPLPPAGLEAGSGSGAAAE